MEKIEQHIIRNIPTGTSLLVALSGGADSVALLAALSSLNYHCRAIHCNYHLRGPESDRDEQHSRLIAQTLGVPLDVIHCDVTAYRHSHRGSSIEMACRDLRYSAFRDSLALHNLDAIAVAHHREDNDETMLLNLLRGTGLRGLTGMPAHRDNIFRPLIDITRPEIEEYLSRRNLTWVIDSTNNSNIFRRNALRNDIIPLIQQHFPNTPAALAQTRQALSNQLLIIQDTVRAAVNTHVTNGDINIATLIASSPHPAPLLYEMLQTLGHRLDYSVVQDIIGKASLSGLRFGQWRLEHGWLRRITPVNYDDPVILNIDQLSQYFNCETITRRDFHPIPDPSTIYLDITDTPPPRFTLRTILPGDRLYPFGMKGSRLISDILKDLHIPQRDRLKQKVLLIDDRIIWLVGLRASRFFSVKPDSVKILKLSL